MTAATLLDGRAVLYLITTANCFSAAIFLVAPTENCSPVVDGLCMAFCNVLTSNIF